MVSARCCRYGYPHVHQRRWHHSHRRGADWQGRPPLGTTLAFMMSVIALSLPEMLILRKVLKLPLIATFAGVVGSGILLVGFLFNAIL
ncbi:permease, partial [Thiolapillus sp.]|uniref:permease n=2 Tax=Thiolapillus sp. TaxID=2017437 RepID=UPI0027E5B6F8